MRGSLVERQSELLLRSDVPGPGVRGRPFSRACTRSRYSAPGSGSKGRNPTVAGALLPAGVVGTSKLPRCNTPLSVDISQVKS